jgi:hypothetical protein
MKKAAVSLILGIVLVGGLFFVSNGGSFVKEHEPTIFSYELAKEHEPTIFSFELSKEHEPSIFSQNLFY